MDSYVIKTQRNQKEKINKVEKKKKLKQLTIESLPRVVVVEEISRLTCTLSKENQNTQSLLQALEGLKNVRPSKEILLSTKIGHRINALQLHENEAIRILAKQIVRDWKKFYRDQRKRQVIEVRSDAKSEMLRMKARKLLADSMQKNITDDLPELIERNVYQFCGRKPDNLYKRKVRKLCFTLKHKNDIKERVSNGEISVEDLVKI